MRHVYECPLRWADMDMLGHVNNVTYVDYLQEARIEMLAGQTAADPGEAEAHQPRDLAEGVVVCRHDVTFLAPLVFRARPVTIDTWVSEVRAATFTLAHEVYDERPDGTRVVYLRARSVLAPYVFAEERPRRIAPSERVMLERFLEYDDSPPAPPWPAAPADAHRFDLRVRWSDVDAYGHVNNVKYFEYLQESRIHLVASLWRRDRDRTAPFVVAQTNVAYRRPILFRHQPYQVVSWPSRLGRTSFTVNSEIRDGDATLAQAEVVMVGFDPATQRAAPLAEPLREGIEWALSRGAREVSPRPGS